MSDFAAYWIVALFAVGMALIFFVTDRHSPASRAIALCLLAMGLAIPENILQFLGMPASTPLVLRLYARFPFEALAMIAGLDWGLRVGLTVVADPESHRIERGMVRLSQALVVVYALLSIARPDLRVEAFLGRADERLAMGPVFYLYLAPLLLAGATIILASLLLLRRRPERAEQIRIVGMLVAMPWLASGLILPTTVGAVAMSIGLLVFLGTAVRYHILQGRQAVFLSRFLSPQINKLVRERGLGNAMQSQRLVISVVCCDLRGFTAYAKASAPERVMAILREYYRAVGEAVTAGGGTIKDQAGDGVLILVGAPIPYPDHAQRALDIAQDIRRRVQAISGGWRNGQQSLGIGIGVASGQVAVGVIGDASRLEYTAVGAAVNLASRLCEKAADGEIRVDIKTLGLIESPPATRAGEDLALKGFSRPVRNAVM